MSEPQEQPQEQPLSYLIGVTCTGYSRMAGCHAYRVETHETAEVVRDPGVPDPYGYLAKQAADAMSLSTLKPLVSAANGTRFFAASE